MMRITTLLFGGTKFTGVDSIGAQQIAKPRRMNRASARPVQLILSIGLHGVPASEECIFVQR